MSIYNVSIWIEYPDGSEMKHDSFVDGDDEYDAILEVKSHLPDGIRLKKVIFINYKEDE
jgi:hypothetical protein